MLCQLAGQQQADGRLNLATRYRRPFVVVRQTRSFGGDALEYIVDERVHDAHRLARYAGVGVHLLQNLVDVDAVALLPALAAIFLVAHANGLRLAGGLLRAFRCSFRSHCARTSRQIVVMSGHWLPAAIYMRRACCPRVM